MVRFAALTGWRKSEILGLRWAQVSFEYSVIRLHVGQTKSGEGRQFPFAGYPELDALLRERRAATDNLLGKSSHFVFHHSGGKPVKDFYTSWRSACKKAGVPGAWLHDLRRSFVMKCEQRGVSRSVAMTLTGHKSEAVYQRYAISPYKAQVEAVGRLSGRG